MLKQFRKKSLIETYDIKGRLEGHIFSYGRIGGGKSVSTESVIQGFKDNFNYKIFDIYGGERKEGLFWTIPSQESNYWNRIRLLGKFDEEGPKQYNVNLLYPYFASKLPKRLPKKHPYVNSKLFTIPLKEIELNDAQMIVGVPSESSKYAFHEIQQLITKKTTASEIPELAKKIKGAQNTPIYKNFILPMSRERFLMDSYCDLNLDLVEETKNVNVVSVLCLDFVPEAYHLLVINYILRKLCELIDANKVPRKNIMFIREAATFFRATDDSVVEDRFKIFRTNLSHYIRMGRRGMYFALDCQSAAETRGIVQGSEDYLLMFKTTAWRDKEELTQELRKERRMTSMQIGDMAFLDKGQAFIAETGRNVKKVQLTLPRTMFWKKEYGNFYKNVWEKFGGSWQTTEESKDYIEDKCEIKKSEVKEIKELPIPSSIPAQINNIGISSLPVPVQDVPIISGSNPVSQVEIEHPIEQSITPLKSKKMLELEEKLELLKRFK